MIILNSDDLKNLENLFRLHGIEAEDAFYAISSYYIQYYQISLTPRLNRILKKGFYSLLKSNKNSQLKNKLDDIIKNDPTGEQLPNIYQFFLAKRFRDQSGKFFTPHSVANAMVNLLPIKDDAIIMDPTCGGGTFLIEAAKRWKNKSYELIGNDIDDMLIDLTELVLSLGTSEKCAKKLIVSNIYNPSLDISELFERIDYIIANPPFSLSIESFDSSSKLFLCGYRSSDALFIDLAFKLLKPGGRLVCLLPHSIISNDEFKDLRLIVEEEWYLLGIIILPEGVFQLTSNTTTRADIVVMEKKGNSKIPKKLLFGNTVTVGNPLNLRKFDSTENDLKELVSNTEVIDALGLTEEGLL